MENHFLVEDEKLIDRLIELIKDTAYHDGQIDNDGYEQVEFHSCYDNEIHDIKDEILLRMKSCTK